MPNIKECYADQICELSFVEYNRLLSLLEKNHLAEGAKYTDAEY